MVEISRTALNIFGFELRWYGLIIALGVLAAVLLACRRERKLGLERDTALNVALVAVPAAIVCARLYYVAFSWEYYAAHPAEIFNVRRGGLAIYGGILGGVLAGYIYCRIKKISFAAGLDLTAPSIALGQAVGRWGNFLNQEAYGRAVENLCLRFFPMAVQIEGEWHYATFFYESLWCALIVAFILAAEGKRFFQRRGDIFLSYVFLYGIERALVEGLRTDSLYLGTIRISQLLSLALVLLATALLARRRGVCCWAVRFLPVCLCLLLGVALALGMGALSAVLSAALIGLTAAIYRKNEPENQQECGTTDDMR